MNIYAHGFGFLLPLYHMEGTCFVDDPREAEAVISMNGDTATVREAQAIAASCGIPLAWLNIEDPNGWLNHEFHHQASAADFVFTSDRECIPRYRDLLGHERIFWLPLACNPELERPLPLAEDATDLVLSMNWYPYEARKWADEMLVRPLARAGYSMTIFSYQEPPYPELKPFWKGGTSAHTVAEQYRHGRVVIGQNNQRSGFDGIHHTVMTSMRTFQALACGRPLLAPASDAYEALGFVNGRDFIWTDDTDSALHWAEVLVHPEKFVADEGAHLIQCMAERGRELVCAKHTYARRLDRIARAIAGEADPYAWD